MARIAQVTRHACLKDMHGLTDGAQVGITRVTQVNARWGRRCVQGAVSTKVQVWDTERSEPLCEGFALALLGLTAS